MRCGASGLTRSRRVSGAFGWSRRRARFSSGALRPRVVVAQKRRAPSGAQVGRTYAALGAKAGRRRA
eukprot:4135771-Lingulodinium_polyedra.AAC.1